MTVNNLINSYFSIYCNKKKYHCKGKRPMSAAYVHSPENPRGKFQTAFKMELKLSDFMEDALANH